MRARWVRTALVIALAAAGLAAGRTDAVRAAPPPDLVVIVVDDLAPLDGRLWRYLPEIQRVFVEQGVTFTDAHGETPLCCPGRAGLLTGQHTHHHRVVRNNAFLLDPRMTIATQVRGVGYRTFWSGKYLNNYRQIAPRVPPGWDGFHASDGGAYYGYDIWHDGRPTPEHRGSAPEDYATDVAVEQFLAEIDATPAGQPLMGWLSLFAPHAPAIAAPRHATDDRCRDHQDWAPPNYNEADVSDKPRYVRALPSLPAPAFDIERMCRAMLAVDEGIARVRARLAATGRLDDTLMLLVGDNGMNSGAHRLHGKSSPYATQIPLFVSWAGRGDSLPGVISERVQNIDIPATLCESAGCRMGPYPNGQARSDGQSFVGLLMRTETTTGRGLALTSLPLATAAASAGGSVTVPAWHAVSTTRASRYRSVGCALASRNGCRWHYVRYETGERELYDLSNGPCHRWHPGRAGDPCRLQNVAGRSAVAGLERELDARLTSLLASRGAGD